MNRKKLKRESENLPIIKRLEVEQLIKEMILNAEPKTRIKEVVSSLYKVEESEFNTCYTIATNELKLSLVESKHVKDVINLHVIEYENIYNYFNNINYLSGKLRVLRAKETLLGYHKENNTLEFNQNNTVVVEQQDSSDYNLDKLSESEKRRFEELMNKVKRNDIKTT